MSEDQEAYYRPLGRLVVAAGRLEWHAYDLAVALGIVKATKSSATAALKSARRQLVDDPPPFSRLTTSDFDRWYQTVDTVLEQRNHLIHSTTAQTFATGTWQPVRLMLRNGCQVVMDPDGIGQLTAEFDVVLNASPIRSVLPEISPGVFLRLVRAPGHEASVSVYYDSAAGWPERLSDEELDEDQTRWWNSLDEAERQQWNAWAQRIQAE